MVHGDKKYEIEDPEKTFQQRKINLIEKTHILACG